MPVWAGLIVGWLVASVAGTVLGIYVGVIVALIGVALLGWYALHVEKTNFEYLCEKCGRALPWGNWRGRNESSSEG